MERYHAAASTVRVENLIASYDRYIAYIQTSQEVECMHMYTYVRSSTQQKPRRWFVDLSTSSVFVGAVTRTRRSSTIDVVFKFVDTRIARPYLVGNGELRMIGWGTKICPTVTRESNCNDGLPYLPSE